LPTTHPPQLYTRPRILFKIPPTVFYPQPKVTSALLSLDFTGRGPDVDRSDLKRVLSTAFQQRRKVGLLQWRAVCLCVCAHR
jgi:16S rRNA (adenine1518-N6/adenine1519-N6)-dimethyltransferase